MGVFVISRWMKIAAWIIAIVIVSLNVRLVYGEIMGWLVKAGENAWVIWVTVIPTCAAAFGLLLYITFKPWLEKRSAERHAAIPHGTAVMLEEIKKPVYKRIAICVDFTKIDSLAIGSALSQGGETASYILLHVTETAGAMVYGSKIDDRESIEDFAALENYRRQIEEKGYSVAIKIDFGNPQNQIPVMVKEFNADLLVMGAHGHKLLKDLIFGTALDVVRHRVDIPVLIVR